ncbi:hypothetical protein N7931_17550 [Catenovulum sp. 2E275]|uniref:DUF6942 family protein n=1 Tax=Catenovulum sp. 2E275 TaxID=2980497 RepID=UPI0021D13304|nr:hypothetical protein [Catenovulum sp. 2E275]MCU4677432.1 hypothetical protein [Catenovulum sp. 2E275]
MHNSDIGFGDQQAQIAVYFEHRPPIDKYIEMDELTGLQPGELDFILANTSNNWRKVFNCFAKLIFALKPAQYTSWQMLRDDSLLTDNGQFALLFSKPDFNQNRIHIIAGRTYAAKLNFEFELTWLTPHFAINQQYKLIVAPYFDYRQLTNERLAQLVKLISSL